VLLLFDPNTRVLLPKFTTLAEEELAKLPIVWLLALGLMSKVAELDIVTTPVEKREPERAKVPAVMLVPPL
jgi:hypothetical protein